MSAKGDSTMRLSANRRNYMLFRVLSICILLAPALPAHSSVCSDHMFAVWYNTNSKTYALALDLSLGYYPPEGQKSFQNLDDLIAYINGVFTKLPEASDQREPAMKLIVNNGNPHGDQLKGVQPITKQELTILLTKTRSIELVWNDEDE